jgi:hypothetical protein
MITVRETTANDLAQVKQLWADGDVMKYVGFPEGLHETDERMQNWFRRIVSSRPTTNHFSIFENAHWPCSGIALPVKTNLSCSHMAIGTAAALFERFDCRHILPCQQTNGQALVLRNRYPVAGVDHIISITADQSQLGHRRIAFLSGLPLHNPRHYRYQNFCAALQEYGLEPDPKLMIDGDGPTNERSGYWAADELLRRGVPFTGVFATNDLMAMGAMKRFWEAGLKIPEDISIVGCDGIAMTEYTTPPLSTLRTPVVTMGKTLMYQLLEKMQPGKTFPRPNQILQAEFVQRESMGPARKDK